jgi:hypothetical protein
VDAQLKLKISRKISRNSMRLTHRYGETVMVMVIVNMSTSKIIIVIICEQ